MGDRKKREKKEKTHHDDLRDVMAGKKSALDSVELDDDDLFEELDEEKYQERVESRRGAGGFVVDDNGLGYQDDGEEFHDVDKSSKRKKNDDDIDDKNENKKMKRMAETMKGQTSIESFTSSSHASTTTSKKDKGTVGQAESINIEEEFSRQQSYQQQSVHSKPNPSVRGRPPTHVQARRGLFPSGRQVQSTYTDDTYDNTVNDNGNDHNDHMEMDTSVTNETQEDSAVLKEAVEPVPVKKESLKDGAVKPLRKAQPKPSEQYDQFKPSLNDGFGSMFSENFASPGMPQDLPLNSQGSPDCGGKLETAKWLQRTEAEGDKPGDEYVDMFWIDASENNGVIYLIGKVFLSDEKRYVSCCVAVHGCKRTLYVLPRATSEYIHVNGKEQKKREEMAKVHPEISALLVPSIIPKVAGQQAFKMKTEKMKYAFEHVNVPREETEYLKIEYLARFGVPSVTQCAGGGSYERIFNATASPLEQFILDRGFMGPCWIKIKHPRSMDTNISYCKIEIAVEDPACVSIINEKRDTPPATTLCVSMKTAVNPSTHVHEIISIAGLVHKEVSMDSESRQELGKPFVFVRPLGISCGSHYPASFPHDLESQVKLIGGKIGLQTHPSERAMLSCFFNKINIEDPDILVSHNLFGFEFDVILARAQALKVPNWNVIGRLRKSRAPKSINDRDSVSGRILCDTYKCAKEFLRETTYSLTHLAGSQLKRPDGSPLKRPEIDPVDVPRYFASTKDILGICNHTVCDTTIVQGLMFKLQLVPLTKQLTNISGNLWSRTVRGARAERIEYLLLHEFHAKGYVLPERKQYENTKRAKVVVDDDNDGADDVKVGGVGRNKAKAAYAGGLVLEPKKGLYDTYILLLDFNSLYPSIIQEYNLCFTTMEWGRYMNDGVATETKGVDQDAEEADEDAENEDPNSNGAKLPDIPDASKDTGILPKVIKSLVDRRKTVKGLLKSEKDPTKRQNLDIKQKAFKLTANSMYGCLGFSFSRFYARPIAALVTKMGREALQSTVDAVRGEGYDVIYGDTDSVMINTATNDLAAVKSIGSDLLKLVNKKYRCLELDVDGYFKSMLLLKKKKYAAITITEDADGKITLEKEMKGLDLVRRDWCPMSKDTGKYIVDQILSGQSKEDIVNAIHTYLSDLSTRVRNGTEPIERFVVTKGLNKNPKDYPDVKGQPHLQVALEMIKQNKPVNIGDHIPYIICTQGPEGATPAARARHPDEVLRSNGELTVDVDWYLSIQILPPVVRLCEVIEGTSAAMISDKLGLDASKFARTSNGDDADDSYAFSARCNMDPAERFKDCKKLSYTCQFCHVESEFPRLDEGACGLTCQKCKASFLGLSQAKDCYAYLCNKISLLVRGCLQRYYNYWLVCDDPSCGQRTMQQSVMGYKCSDRCHGRMKQEYDDSQLHTQLKYLECLFDLDKTQFESIKKDFSVDEREVFNLLRIHMKNMIDGSAYNWIRPSLWTAIKRKGITA